MGQTNLVGKNILGYTVIEKIGSGAFATVYKVVKSNVSGQYVRALKHITIPSEKQYYSVLNSMGGDVSKAENYFSQMLNNIVSEIRILNSLSDKGIQNIVRYYENDITASHSPTRYDIYILMEYLTPLEDYLEENDFRVKDVIKLGLEVLKGLRLCHENGIIHRDIKDDNIFVSSEGEYKIGDFGVSKVLNDSSKAESLKGTPNFLAPEVYLGKESYSKSVDLYSLGIVLYRLLNYNRNPFLPPFPNQYFSQDEDNAFEMRMMGKIPNYPIIGGDLIGKVIVKSISDSSSRYQTADEFINDLKDAFDSTADEILNQKIGISFASYVPSDKDSETAEYNSTIGEVTTPCFDEKDNGEELSHDINKHLFETVGEIPQNNVFDDTVVVEEKETIVHDKGTINSSLRKDDLLSSTGTNGIQQKNISVFIAPILILLIGLIAFFIKLPFYISKMFWCCWFVVFTISLFFVGKKFQTISEPDSKNAILVKKEAYFLACDIFDSLELLKVSNNEEIKSLKISMKKLKERLSIESDFGYGDSTVIDCENSIAQKLYTLKMVANSLDEENLESKVETMNHNIKSVNLLLKKRVELKKK